jgi:hypothetical protein
MLTTVLLFGGAYAEGYALANDQEQAISPRVPGGAPHRRVQPTAQARGQDHAGQDRVPRLAFNATIAAIASDAGSAAAAKPDRR